jgi:hypothetical protein
LSQVRAGHHARGGESSENQARSPHSLCGFFALWGGMAAFWPRFFKLAQLLGTWGSKHLSDYKSICP